MQEKKLQRIKVKFISEDDPLALRVGKIYEAFLSYNIRSIIITRIGNCSCSGYLYEEVELLQVKYQRMIR